MRATLYRGKIKFSWRLIMKKKLFLITGLMLLATAVFADDMEVMWTSSGRMALVLYQYMGQYKGQEAVSYNVVKSAKFRISKPSADHWDIVREVLNKYDTEKGDTFLIMMGFAITPTSTTLPSTFTEVICEFSSATEYHYWVFEGKTGL
jgi:hypothetical protein